MPAEMTMLADHPARQLLDFSQKLDINLLDNVVNSMYHDIGSQVCFMCFTFSQSSATFKSLMGLGACLVANTCMLD